MVPKETNKTKRQHRLGKKYLQTMQKPKLQTTPQKMGRRSRETFLQRNDTDGQKHMKRSSTSLSEKSNLKL